MASHEDYKNLINDIIAKQTVVLGSDIVLLKAKNVSGLALDSSGKVISLSGNPQEILQKLIDEYVTLSGQIVKNILTPILEKYPDIKISI
ncbi:MAG: hypothetical protein HY545_00250 [Candidatus Doudnabacteria bacterium]|nr:hypothetical protein [Candidatus Doudnabacteria bacterium]